MRVSTNQLQRLTIFTTVLTGGGIGTMYHLQQKKFTESDYHKMAVQKLEACPVAMEFLGSPLKVHNIHLTDKSNRIDQHTAQLKIPVTGSKSGGYLYTSSIRNPHNRRNHTDLEEIASFVKEELAGTGRLQGYRWMHLRAIQRGWILKQCTLKMREGEILDLLTPPAAGHTDTGGDTTVLDIRYWD